MQFYGGVDSVNINAQSYSSPSSLKSLGISMHPVKNIEIAELTKVVENADRYLQIAFAEDLYLYCQANNINFPELRDALNTKWNVKYLRTKRWNRRTLSPKRHQDVSTIIKSEQT
jgi:hypothetical protein